MKFLIIAWFILVGIAVVCSIIWIILTIKIARYKRENDRIIQQKRKRNNQCKTFKFELGGSFIFYHGDTMGEAIKEFIMYRPNRLNEITNIIEMPIDKL